MRPKTRTDWELVGFVVLLIACLVGPPAINLWAETGWFTAKIKLARDHKKGDEVVCKTWFRWAKESVSCEEKKE
jgi:hypothetical protein